MFDNSPEKIKKKLFQALEASHFVAPETVFRLTDKLGSVDVRDENDSTPLMYAAQNGNPELVRALLAAGASVNEKNKGGLTALMYASVKGFSDVIEELIKAGAALDERDSAGFTAFLYAHRELDTSYAQYKIRYEKVLIALTKAGAELPIHVYTDCYKDLPLMVWGVYNRNSALLQAFIDRDVDINAQDDSYHNNDTPLITAFKIKRSDIARMLIAGGANTSLKNSKGTTATLIMEESGLDTDPAFQQLSLMVDKEKLEQFAQEQAVLQTDIKPVKKFKIITPKRRANGL